MPPHPLPPDDPREWLRRSESDLALARAHVSGVCLEDLCYHGQQAAEKALKALLLQRTGGFPYVHDLAALVSQLESANVTVPPAVRTAVALSKYAVDSRYPGLSDPVTEDERTQVVDQATQVVKWVTATLAPVSMDRPNEPAPDAE